MQCKILPARRGHLRNTFVKGWHSYCFFFEKAVVPVSLLCDYGAGPNRYLASARVCSRGPGVPVQIKVTICGKGTL